MAVFSQIVNVVRGEKRVRQYTHYFGRTIRERSERQAVAVAAVKAKFGKCFPGCTFVAGHNG